MPAPVPGRASFVEDSLQFEYIEGAVSRIPGGHSTGWRELPFSVCAQIRKGRVRLSLGDGSSREVGDGQAFILQTGVRNLVEKSSSGLLLSRFAHLRLTVLSTIDALAFWETPLVVDLPHADRLGELCARLAQSEASPDGSRMRKRIEQKALGFRLAEEIVSLSRPRPDAMASVELLSRLAPVFRALHDDLAARHTVDALADRVHLSPSRFHALFRSTVGAAPLAYLQQLRLDKAKRLLLEGDLGIAEIAEKVGYPDPFHFSRLFRRYAGLSPRNYRESVRGGMWLRAE